MRRRRRVDGAACVEGRRRRWRRRRWRWLLQPGRGTQPFWTVHAADAALGNLRLERQALRKGLVPLVEAAVKLGILAAPALHAASVVLGRVAVAPVIRLDLRRHWWEAWWRRRGRGRGWQRWRRRLQPRLRAEPLVRVDAAAVHCLVRERQALGDAWPIWPPKAAEATGVLAAVRFCARSKVFRRGGMAARPELVLGERGGRQEDQHGCNNATRASPLTAGTFLGRFFEVRADGRTTLWALWGRRGAVSRVLAVKTAWSGSHQTSAGPLRRIRGRQSHGGDGRTVHQQQRSGQSAADVGIRHRGRLLAALLVAQYNIARSKVLGQLRRWPQTMCASLLGATAPAHI